MAPTRKLAELFYEITARTEGLEKDLNSAQRSFGKLTAYVWKNPVAAIAAVGTAAAGVAVQAARMAQDVEKSLKRVGIATNASAAEIKKLGKEIETLSQQTGVAQQDLAAAAAQAAKSASTAGDVGLRLKAALELSQASGEDLGTVLDGLSQVLDAFGLSSADAERAVAILYKTTKGKQGLDDMFAALQAAAPALAKTGIDIETAARALTALGSEGKGPKQAAKAFSELADGSAKGAAKLREWAATVPPATGAVQELKKAVDEANNSTEGLTNRLKTELATELIALGRTLLPAVNAVLLETVALMARIRGGISTGDVTKAVAELRTASSDVLGDPLDKLGGIRAGMKDAVSAVEDLSKAFRQGALDLSSLTKSELAQFIAKVESMKTGVAADPATEKYFPGIREALNFVSMAAQNAKLDLLALESQGPLKRTTPAKSQTDAEVKAAYEAQLAAAHAALDKFQADRAASLTKGTKAISDASLNAVREGVMALAAGMDDQITVLTVKLSNELQALWKVNATPEAIAIATAPTRAALKSAQELRAAVRKIELPEAVRAKFEEGLTGVQREVDKLREKLIKAGATQKEIASETTKKALEGVAQVYEDIGYSVDVAREKADELVNGSTKWEKIVAKVAKNILDLADSILAVANALGVVDQKAANIARGAIGLGQAVAKGNWLQAAAGAADIVAGIAQGNREQAERHREAMATLKGIEQHTGDMLTLGLTGRQVGGTRAGIAAVRATDAFSFSRTSGGAFFKNWEKEIEGALAPLGLTLADLQAVADKFGITLGVNEQAWKDLDAILHAIDFSALTETFEGMMETAATRRRVFGTQSPLDELLDAQAILEKLSPKFKEIFEGLDLSLAEDRITAWERVKAAFGEAMTAGELTDEELGGLTLPQFLDSLGDLGELIRALIPELDDVGDGFDDVAKEAAKAAAALSATFAGIDLDAAIFGTSAEATLGQKLKAAGFGGADLSTQAGRDAMVAAIREAARGTTDTATKQIYADLIKALDNLPDLIADGVAEATGTKAPGGAGRTIDTSAETLTIFQGDRLITIAETQLVRQTQIRDLIAGAMLTRTQGLPVPTSMAYATATTGGAVQAGAVSFNVSVHVPAGTTEPRAIGEAVVNQFLADAMVRERFLSGSTRVT